MGKIYDLALGAFFDYNKARQPKDTGQREPPKAEPYTGGEVRKLVEDVAHIIEGYIADKSLEG
jgi:hypothetical protein